MTFDEVLWRHAYYCFDSAKMLLFYLLFLFLKGSNIQYIRCRSVAVILWPQRFDIPEFQQVSAVEGSSLPKCIGPGCERDALPDSVYCGNDCILKHAAAAMKTITTDGKDSKQKERGRPKAQKKTTNKTPNKVFIGTQ